MLTTQKTTNKYTMQMMLNSLEDKAVHLLEIWLSKKGKRQMRTEESIVDLSLSKMELSIQVNGIQVSEMVLVVKCGQMAQDMKVIGNLIKPTVKENLSMLTVIFMRANGSMIKLMEKVLILTPMELITMVIGLMINNMVSEWSHGLMGLNTKVTISTVKKKAKENLHLLMEAITKVNLNKMKYVGMENTIGQMVSNMTANGVIIKCTEKEFLFGRTKRNTKDNL
jgi:hypothetical protein